MSVDAMVKLAEAHLPPVHEVSSVDGSFSGLT